MADPNVEIINQALIHIGVTGKIADIENTDLNEAEAVKSVYGDALDEIFRAVNWNFAKCFKALNLLDETDYPDDLPADQFEFAYALPTDCRFPRRIDSGIPAELETARDKIPFEIVHGKTTTVLVTNHPDAVLEYTKNVEDPIRWDGLFKRAFALRLAMLVAPAVAKGDPFKVTERVERQYNKAIAKAIKRNRTEGRKKGRPESPMIQERN